ncbi:MAG TPA: glycosyltransferase family 2 protein [Caldithrix sp.]|nr:glycosyltransferase family 2 protein [Caldithrix sp.]
MTRIACIVLPTYNEADNVSIIIPEIFKQAGKVKSHELHVLVVDDTSPDGTGDVIKKLQKNYQNLHLITGEKEGLGKAYQRGMKHAIDVLKSDIIFEMDADLQHDPALIPLFVTLSNHGFSLVIGSRFAPGASTPNFGLYRKFLSHFGNFLVRFFGGLPRLHDCTSGYRCIKADLIAKCELKDLSIRGYSFQTSLLFELLRHGAKVLEIPITFPDRKHGDSKLAFEDQFEFMVNLVKLRFRKYYEFLKFSFIGFIGIVVNLGIYVLLTRVAALSMEFAALIAIETSVVLNFLLNNLWDLRSREGVPNAFVRLFRYHNRSAIGLVTNYIILLAGVYKLEMYDLLANFIGILIGIVINYGMNAFYVWRDIKYDNYKN